MRKLCRNTRISTEWAQRTMTMFELSVYLPNIREALTDSGIGQLEVDSTPGRTWFDLSRLWSIGLVNGNFNREGKRVGWGQTSR